MRIQRKRAGGQTVRLNFTNTVIEKLPTPATGRGTYYDTRARGLVLFTQTSGHRAFSWYRSVQGRPRLIGIGTFPDLTVDQARDAADTHNSTLADWKAKNFAPPDPFGPKRGDVTLGDLVDEYVSQHLLAKAKRPEHAAQYARWLFNQYVGAWRDRAPETIARKHVAALHADIGRDHGHHAANRTIQFLRTVFNHAIDAERISVANPCARVKKILFHEAKRARFLQADELPKFFAALLPEKNTDLRDFIILGLATAARCGDVLSMRWADRDKARNVWTIPDPKARTPYLVPLHLIARDVLKRREDTSTSEWVFPSTGATGHLTEIKRGWKQFLKRAGLENFRIHDLRRSRASWQAMNGDSSIIIGKSLGHSGKSVTDIYARLDIEPVRKSVDGAIDAMLKAGKVSRRKLLAAGKTNAIAGA